MLDLNVNSEILIKKQLERERLTLQKRISELKSQDPFSDVDRLTDNAASDGEASEESGHERILALITALQSQLTEVESALARLESGQFGKCQNCCKSIEDKRLQILPSATLCISCEANK